MTVDDLGADGALGEAAAAAAELDLAADGLTTGGPMVGIAIRLPVATLDAARLIAHDEGVKVTAMLREWIDQRVAERVDDARVVSVADLRRLIAHRAQDLQPGRDVSGDRLHTGQAAPEQTTAASATPRAAEVAKPKSAEVAKPKTATAGKHKGKASGGAKAKGKSK